MIDQNPSFLVHRFRDWLSDTAPKLSSGLIWRGGGGGGGEPELTSTTLVGNRPSRLRSSERAAIGLASQDGKPVGVVLVPKEKSSTSRSAAELADSHPGNLITRVMSRSLKLSEPEQLSGATKTRPREIALGASVGHFQGFPSTLGLFVQMRGERGYPGFVGSAFALSLSGRARVGDPILCPGFPDAPRFSRNRVGTRLAAQRLGEGGP
jgi:hypothetical protein